MEDEHDVVRHSFLGNEHFFSSINDEVTALVVDAFFRIFCYFDVVQVL